MEYGFTGKLPDYGLPCKPDGELKRSVFNWTWPPISQEAEPDNFMRRLVLFIALATLALTFVSCSDSTDYRRFVGRDSKYYAELADSCRTLIRTTGASATFGGGATNLPLAIRELNATTVEVDTNRVFIMMAKGRVRYAIVWEQSDNKPPVWELSTNAEGLRKVLFRSRDSSTTP